MAEMKGLKVRVRARRSARKTVRRRRMSPTVIAYDEIYNAIQTV